MAALIPVAVGVGGFAIGYVTSQYMTPTGTSEDNVPEQLLTDSKLQNSKNDKKLLPPKVTTELKKFDKTKLTKVQQNKPYRTPTLIDDLSSKLKVRRVSIKEKVEKSEEITSDSDEEKNK